MIFIDMKKNSDYSDDPFFQYSDEERRNMTKEEYCAMLEEHNEYVRKKYSQLNEQVPPKFNSVEELRAYYNCMPLDEAERKLNDLFNK